jgi:hypothetical protein
MKRALYRLSAAWVLGVMLSLPHLTYAQNMPSDTAPSLCLDGMETVPIEDDLAPIEISTDGGCMVSQTPISI